mmetsp:Transcript_17263/g.23981  ORF Transcript_17263/g.23981 Transcript_17263/m.23981 type:complete len:114 (-) Transcript_17263:782-1123(-)
MAARLNQIGVPAMAFDAWDVGVRTDSKFGDASLLPSAEEDIRASFDRIDPNVVAVVTGFIGHEPQGRITTLGRGGSDLTATAIGGYQPIAHDRHSYERPKDGAKCQTCSSCKL